MTVFGKWIACWAGFFAGGVITGMLAMDRPLIFSVPFFLNLVVWTLIARSITCDQCGTPVYQTEDDYYRRPRMFRVPVRILKRTCHTCGCDLSKHAT